MLLRKQICPQPSMTRHDMSCRVVMIGMGYIYESVTARGCRGGGVGRGGVLLTAPVTPYSHSPTEGNFDIRQSSPLVAQNRSKSSPGEVI